MTILFLRTLAAMPHERGFGAPPAAGGEWAVTGAFRYAHRDPATLMGRERLAFQRSWYGLGSFAPCRRVEVAPIDAAALEAVARRLAAHLMEGWGVEVPEAAIDAAREEIEFGLSLATHAPGTVLALQREFNEQGLIEQALVDASGEGRD